MGKLVAVIITAWLALTGIAAAAEYYQGQGYVRVHDSVGAGYDEQNDNMVYGSFFVHLHNFVPGQLVRVKVENRGHHPTAPYAKVAGPWMLTIGADGMAKAPVVTLLDQEYKVKIQLDHGTEAEVKDYYNFEVRGVGSPPEPAPTPTPTPAPKPKPAPKPPPHTSPATAPHQHVIADPSGETNGASGVAASASPHDAALDRHPPASPPPASSDPEALMQEESVAAGAASSRAGDHQPAPNERRADGLPWATIAGTSTGLVVGAGSVLLFRRRPKTRPD